MAPGNDNASTAGNLLAAGLFLATALASQCLQHHLNQGDFSDIDDDDDSYEKHHRRRMQRQRLRRQREQQNHYPRQYANRSVWREEVEDEDEDEGYQDDEDPTLSDLRPRVEFSDFYKMRRLEGRLSFENLRPMIQAAEIPAENGQAMPPQFPTSNPQNLSHNHTSLSRKPKSHHRRRGRRGDSAVDREDEYDFLPKNSNWNHFEKYNEDDLRNGVVVPGPSPSGAYHHYQAFSNGYNKEYANDQGDDTDRTADTGVARGGGGGSSDSSEEPQFVWTEAAREKRASCSRSPRHEPLTLDTLNPTELGLPNMDPLATQGPTISAELPAPTRPCRSMTGDSLATVPTQNVTNGNKQPPANATSSAVSPDPAENGGPRSFLRHASSIGTGSDSPPDSGWLPQRFLPTQTAEVLEKSPLQSCLSATSSEISPSSDTPRGSPSNYKNGYSDKNGYSEDIYNSSHRSARAQYNAKIMPNKVVMVRHGQSMGNINEDLYSTTPDNAMPLTQLGWDQARKSGEHLKNNVLAASESVHFIVSPYARTVETFHGIASAWCDPESPEFASIPNRELTLKAWYGKLLEMGLTWHEDPRIREQDFGNYQDRELIRQAKKDRHRFGTFYYRFPHGESAADVFDRVSTFLDSLWRSFDMNRSRNYVLVTHGISIRVLLARYFRYTIHQFNILSNPRNCEMVVLNHDGHGRLRLQGRCQLHLKERKSNGKDDDEKKAKVFEVDEYKFDKRLRILPQAAIRKVDIRMCYNDGATKQV